MYRKRTVFILGAGASWHYGYPTGERLVDEVRENAKKMAEYCKAARDLNRLWWPSFINNRDEWVKWQTNFAQLYKSLLEADPVVIDYFLAKNEQLHDAGTLLIAWTILAREQNYNKAKNWFNRNELVPGGKNKEFQNDNWIRFVSHRLIDTAAESAEILENNVHFVTFNYDTSLEASFHKYLRNHSSINTNHMRDFITRKRIIHVYGAIRDQTEHPVQDQFAFNISSNQSDADGQKAMKHCLEIAREAGGRLSVIEPNTKDSQNLSLYAARQVIKEAEDIYILGYGFDEINNRRIGLDVLTKDLTPHSPLRTIHYTNFNDSRRVQRVVRSLFFGGDPKSINVDGDWVSFHRRAAIVESTKNVYDALAFDFQH